MVDEIPPAPDFKPHCLNLDAEVVYLANRKLLKITGSKRMLSAFVNQLLEEFVLDGEERPETTIRQMARTVTEKIRADRLAQRKLVTEKPSDERKALIDQATRDAVRKLHFKREWIRDAPHMNFEHRRRQLEDAVSMACRLDIQFKDIASIVTEAVLEGGDA